MDTWTNQPKHASTFTNDAFGGTDLTWNEANFTWNEADGTWDNPFSWINDTKSASTFINDPKH